MNFVSGIRKSEGLQVKKVSIPLGTPDRETTLSKEGNSEPSDGDMTGVIISDATVDCGQAATDTQWPRRHILDIA